MSIDGVKSNVIKYQIFAHQLVVDNNTAVSVSYREFPYLIFIL